MSKADKLLVKMKQNPRDWRIDSLKTIASANNIEWRQPGTSHVTFRHPNGNKLTVPAHRSIKPLYIKKFVRLVEKGLGD
jgi:predicted RNA binding protein YcfA (HicA-like mRNA interferase family)